MAAKPKERKVGTVEHYYPKVHAASVGLEDDLRLGDKVHIHGHGDDLRETVSSLQLDHAPIQEGHAGQHIGLLVPGKVHRKAEVFVEEPKVSARPKAAAKKASKRAKKAAKRTKKAKKAAHKAPKRPKAGKKKPKAAPSRKPGKKAKRAKGKRKR